MRKETNKDKRNGLIDLQKNILISADKLHEMYNKLSEEIFSIPPFDKEIPNDLIYIGEIHHSRKGYSVFALRNTVNLASIIIGDENSILGSCLKHWNSYLPSKDDKRVSDDKAISKIYRSIFPYLRLVVKDLKYEDKLRNCNGSFDRFMTKVIDSPSHSIKWADDDLTANCIKHTLCETLESIVYWNGLDFEYMEIHLSHVPMQPRVNLSIGMNGVTKTFTYLDR